MSRPTFRFAPSPNGELHLGHAYSALANESLARRAGGRLLLRLEDIDTVRCTPQFETGVLDDLAWLGIEWEQPVRRQSEHFGVYRAALDRLVAQGLAYPAFMSRADISAYVASRDASAAPWPRDPDGAPLYPGLDRDLPDSRRRAMVAEGRPFAWRLDMGRAVMQAGDGLAWTENDEDDPARSLSVSADPQAWGDVVLARRDTPTSYHLSVVVDDALQGVTTVVRGRDLRQATSVHRVLQVLLGLPAPDYLHHRLILGPDGRKLSKSRGDTGLRALARDGVTAAEIRRRLGFA